MSLNRSENKMNVLDVANMPLQAYALVEASAGTGKTYTISQLVLRLILLGLDGEATEPLNIDQILVVTFTKAATQELKDRIRANLLQAIKMLKNWQAVQQPIASTAADKLDSDQALEQICAKAISCLGMKTVLQRLQQSSFTIDEAAIFTIHSFCQHVLSNYAFATGQAFEKQLLESSETIIRDMAIKLWREQVYRFDIEQMALMQSYFSNPQVLLQSFSALLSCHLLDQTAVSEENSLKHAAAFATFHQQSSQCQQLFAEIKTDYAKAKHDLQALFDGAKLGASYRKDHMPKRWRALDEYLSLGSALQGLDVDDKKDFKRYFCQSFIDAKAKQALSHPLFVKLDQLSNAQKILFGQLCTAIRTSLIKLIDEFKVENNIFFFDDLIDACHKSLSSEFENASDAENTSPLHLANLLRAQFPAALIDEFQDTDNTQFRIFDAIYRQSPAHLLFMIGDPKQAIYSFRGADIQAYFSARHRVDSAKQYSLAKNWRTLPSLVTTVNQIFSMHCDSFVQQDFPAYPQVGSPASFNDWQGLAIANNPSSAFSAFVADAVELDQLSSSLPLNKEIGEKLAAKKTAGFIADLLNKRAKLNQQDIEPKDIAILVRKGSQAKLMQAALNEQGVNSIFLSKDSVLASAEFDGFVRLLQACISPYDRALVLAALGDALIMYSDQEIRQLLDDENQVFAIQARFAEFKQLSEQRGFMSMWQSLVTEFSIAENLLQRLDGERRYTNLQQLAELFQQQCLQNSQHQDVCLAHQLSQFLAFAQMQNLALEQSIEGRKLRLESEANLVEIVTIHGSKGLEYPLVCCPFISSGDDLRAGFKKVYSKVEQAYTISWRASEQDKAQLIMEQLAEDVRLLYVAFTRAKYHLNICWLPQNKVDKSALWHVLANHEQSTLAGTKADKNLCLETFNQLLNQLDSCDINPVINANQSIQDSNAIGTLVLADLQRKHSLEYVARSYSALMMPSHSVYHSDGLSTAQAADADMTMQQLEAQSAYDELNPVAAFNELTMAHTESELSEQEKFASIFHFPRGAHAGNFLHLLFENIDFQQAEADLLIEMPKLLQRFQISDQWSDCLMQMVSIILNKPMPHEQPEQSFCLADISSFELKKEMGFHLMAKPIEGEKIAQLLSQYRGGEAVASLQNINGYFKGFIDLSFAVNGQYFVLDYKSNHLGFSISDYNQAAMHEAMLSHDYDLQYLIYSLALHRLLQRRLADYDYDQHFGGVYYLFLRGINRDGPEGVYFAKPDKAVIKRLDAMFESGALADVVNSLRSNTHRGV